MTMSNNEICNQYVSIQSNPSVKKVVGFANRPIADGFITNMKSLAGIGSATDDVFHCATAHGVPSVK